MDLDLLRSLTIKKKKVSFVDFEVVLVSIEIKNSK